MKLNFIDNTKNNFKRSKMGGSYDIHIQNSGITYSKTGSSEAIDSNKVLNHMMATTGKSTRANNFATLWFVITLILSFFYPPFFLLALICLGMKVYANSKGVITLNYTIDEQKEKEIENRMDSLLSILESDKVWRMMPSTKAKKKESDSDMDRFVCQKATKPPFPFKTNCQVVSLKINGETLLFFPDKLFVISTMHTVTFSYDEIKLNKRTVKFVEKETLPKDAKVVDHMTDSTKAKGRKYPVCQYGELEITSDVGYNAVIMYSNPKK